MKQSLTLRINVIIVLVVTLILLIFGAYEQQQTWSRIEEQLRQSLNIITTRLTLTLANPTWTFNGDSVTAFITSEMADENVYAVVVKSSLNNEIVKGKVRTANWQLRDITPQENITAYIQQSGTIKMYDEPIGTVEVYITDRFLNERFQQDVIILVTKIILLLIGIVITLGLTIDKNVSQPLKNFTQQVELIAKGTLNQPIKTNRVDEIGRLASSFIVMQENIQEKITRLNGEIHERLAAESSVRQLNEELEARVELRTRQLSEQNQLLGQQAQILAEQRVIAESLYEVAIVINSSLDQKTVLAKVLAQLKRVIEYDSAGLFLKVNDSLLLSDGVGINKKHIGQMIPLTSNIRVAQVFNSKHPYVTPDVQTDPHWRAFVGDEPIRSWLAAPLIIGQNELGVLTVDSFQVNAYNEADIKILQTFANQATIAIQNARLFAEVKQAKNRMDNELALARDIQYSLLPPIRPNWPYLDVICYTIPANEVGGDFYQYHVSHFPPNNELKAKYIFAVGDVSGKGVSAALLMATSLSQFDASLSQPLSPTERMAYLDRAISLYTKPRRQNCAMCYVELELRDEKKLSQDNAIIINSQFLLPYSLLHVINAGCIPPYIKRVNGSVEHIEMSGFALGLGLGAIAGYQQYTFELFPGDMVILISDGVVEANNHFGDMLSFDRLMQIVSGFDFNNFQGHGLSGAEAMLNYLQRTILEFTGAAEQHDDMTIIVVQV